MPRALRFVARRHVALRVVKGGTDDVAAGAIAVVEHVLRACRRHRRRTSGRHARGCPTAWSTAASGSPGRRRRCRWRSDHRSAAGSSCSACRRAWWASAPADGGAATGWLRRDSRAAATGRTFCRFSPRRCLAGLFRGVSRLSRPRSSSAPKSPQVEPAGDGSSVDCLPCPFPPSTGLKPCFGRRRVSRAAATARLTRAGLFFTAQTMGTKATAWSTES